jgi:flavin reductase (DIM6/NTAB) family NADH-FMN oxidoreductase RutF
MATVHTARVPLNHVHRLLSPRIAYLVLTLDDKNRLNVAPISNLTSISTKPQHLALAVFSQWATCKNLRANSDFSISIPTSQHAACVWIAASRYANLRIPCGVSKFEATGFTVRPATFVRTPLISECYAHLECKVTWDRPVGDHVLFVGEILAGWIDQKLLNADGVVDVENASPLMQNSGDRFVRLGSEFQIDHDTVSALLARRQAPPNT